MQKSAQIGANACSKLRKILTIRAYAKKQTQCQPAAGSTKFEFLNPKPERSHVYYYEKTKPIHKGLRMT